MANRNGRPKMKISDEVKNNILSLHSQGKGSRYIGEAVGMSHTKENFNNAYADIKRELAQHGFERQQGSVYFGTKEKTVVEIIIAVQEISEKLKWLAQSVTEIRLLKIEEFNDLMPAVEKGSKK